MFKGNQLFYRSIYKVNQILTRTNVIDDGVNVRLMLLSHAKTLATRNECRLKGGLERQTVLSN